MYLTTPGNDPVALDATWRGEIWRYKHQINADKLCCGPANKGAAIAHGMIYMATVDAAPISGRRQYRALRHVSFTFPIPIGPGIDYNSSRWEYKVSDRDMLPRGDYVDTGLTYVKTTSPRKVGLSRRP